MKTRLPAILLILLCPILLCGQPLSNEYEPTDKNPFGMLNPEAPPQTVEFSPMIGLCDSRSIQRKTDGSWQDTLNMQWKFKYIMNGTAIQDEVWRDNGIYAVSIRQFHADSAKWVVTYFSYPYVSTKPGTWLGTKENNDIVLYQDQKAPNGMEGVSRLTFYAINGNGFKWRGDWVSADGRVVYAFWEIDCKKR